MADLNLTRLRYFITIAQLGNLRRASQALHITQPALSRHVQLLEEDLGVTLLSRNARGVMPTEAGELLARSASVLMQMAGQLRADLRSKASVPRGTVRLGTLPSVAQMLSPHAVAACRAEWKQVVFSMVQSDTSQLQEMLLADRLDLAAFTDLGPHPDLTQEPLYEEELWVVGRAGLMPAKGKTVKLVDLAGRPLIVSRVLRQQLERLLDPADLDVVVELQSTVPMSALLADGVGLFFGPATLFWDAIQGGELQGRPVEDMRSRRVLAWRKTRPHTAATLAVAGQFQASVRELSRRKNSPIKPIS